MNKLSVFTAPKPFTEAHINRIQRNAIRSWLEMGDEVEVLLVGEEEGIADAAAALGVTHVPGVAKNKQGTPLVSSIFGLACENSRADLFLFSNTDMLFMPETLGLALQMKQRADDFVLLGQRYDLDVDTEIDFSPGWDKRLLGEVVHRGRLHPMGGSDYFLFPSGLFSQIPDFAIGRAGWDNWMIYHALAEGSLVVDATPSLVAIHQNHGYQHLAGEDGHQRHPETLENLELAGGMRKMFSLLDVKYQLKDGKIRRISWSLARFLRGIEQRLQPDELVGRGPRWWLLRSVRKLRRALQKYEMKADRFLPIYRSDKQP
jgi:hypothetical protein